MIWSCYEYMGIILVKHPLPDQPLRYRPLVFIPSFRHRVYLPFLRSALEVVTINTASASIFKTGI